MDETLPRRAAKPAQHNPSTAGEPSMYPFRAIYDRGRKSSDGILAALERMRAGCCKW
jgi:hypothetical protein